MDNFHYDCHKLAHNHHTISSVGFVPTGPRPICHTLMVPEPAERELLDLARLTTMRLPGRVAGVGTPELDDVRIRNSCSDVSSTLEALPLVLVLTELS